MNAQNTTDGISFLLFFFGFFGFVIFLIIIGEKLEKKRRKEIEDYCKQNQLHYSDRVSNIPNNARAFSLINRSGRDISYYAGMSGNRGGINFNIFDYKFTTGSGKHSHTHFYMICILSSENLDMPKFYVRTENFFDSIGKLFGGQDINFTEDPTFSKAFVLQGQPEDSVRMFFNSKVRQTFVNNHQTNYQYEGFKNCFMIAYLRNGNLKDRLILLSNAIKIFKGIVPKDSEEMLS